ncbi:MAG: molybdopterin cofactor-binding domain-containing protein [Povalibacter sp.]
MTKLESLTRREFVIGTSVVAGGFALSILPTAAESSTVDPKAMELTPWIVINKDNTVIVRVPGPEAGTGGSTQVAMLVAEELQCEWKSIRVEPISFRRNAVENNLYLKDSGVWSSFAGGACAPEIQATLLQAGASARERLRVAAARQWQVAIEEVNARDGMLLHTSSSRSLTYGDIAALAAAVQLKDEPKPKAEEEWTLLRKHTPAKLHVPAVINGTSIFGMDVRLPGMLYAALVQCPVHGGKLKRYDFEAIRRMPGVRGIAVIDPSQQKPEMTKTAFWANTALQSGVAVLADHYWQARKALDALPIEWNLGDGAAWANTQQLYNALLARLDEPAEDLVKDEGDAPRVISAAGERALSATYHTPLCDHAPLEPLNGTALVTKDRVELWHPTAFAQQAQMIAQEETGLPPENIEVHLPLIGGSFGRRVGGDDVRMVLAVAKQFPGTPVHVIWSREETFRQGRYRDLQAVKLHAALDDRGLPEALTMHVAGHNPTLLGLQDNVYVSGCVPHVRVEQSKVPMHLLVGQFRGPGYNTHCFVMESFIDECAAHARIDPLKYRQMILRTWPDAGWQKCLDEVATRAQWGRELPKGYGQGLALGNWAMGGKPESGTTAAAIATVEVAEAGALKVHSLDLAFDSGKILNKDAVLAQLQGSMIFGMNVCMNEELAIENGQVVDDNFHRYPMLRMADVPSRVDVHFGAVSGHARYGGPGEVGTGLVAPAIANAIFRATGRRLRSMPFRKQFA